MTATQAEIDLYGNGYNEGNDAVKKRRDLDAEPSSKSSHFINGWVDGFNDALEDEHKDAQLDFHV